MHAPVSGLYVLVPAGLAAPPASPGVVVAGAAGKDAADGAGAGDVVGDDGDQTSKADNDIINALAGEDPATGLGASARVGMELAEKDALAVGTMMRTNR